MQSAYIILQMRTIPDFTVGLINHQPAAQQYRPNEWIGPFSWDSWVIDYASYPDTVWELELDGKMRTFVRPAQSWYLYSPNLSYRHKDTITPAHVEHLWFYFKLHKKLPPLSTRRFSVILDPRERMANHVRAMAELYQSGVPGAELIIHGHALTIFGEILAAAQRGNAGGVLDPWIVTTPVAAISVDETLLAQIDRSVTSRIRNVPTLDELAEELSMSVSSLAHRFKAETGLSVMERVRWLRIREARTLLTRRGASVKSVARALKFSSPFHFSKLFHEITGVRANAYIRQTR